MDTLAWFQTSGVDAYQPLTSHSSSSSSSLDQRNSNFLASENKHLDLYSAPWAAAAVEKRQFGWVDDDGPG